MEKSSGRSCPLVEQVGDEGMKETAKNYYAVSSEWWGNQPSLTDYMNGYARRGALIRMLGTFMQQYPIVLMPVSAEQAFEQDADIASVESMRRVMAAQCTMMAVPILGFPAVSVPTGVDGGLPPRPDPLDDASTKMASSTPPRSLKPGPAHSRRLTPASQDKSSGRACR